MIDANIDKDFYIMETLPENNKSPYENNSDFEPTSIICFKNCLYQIGGLLKFFNSDRGCTDCFSFNITSKKWTVINKLNVARINPGIVTSKTSIFVFGGTEESDNERFSNSDRFKICIEKFDPQNNKWEMIFLRNLEKATFDCFYSNIKFITCLDSENSFMILNLQMNKCFVVSTGKEGELFETSVGEPFSLFEVLEEKQMLKYEDKWYNDKIVVMNKNAQICFIENGDIFLLKIKEDEKEFKISWDSEILTWNLI